MRDLPATPLRRMLHVACRMSHAIGVNHPDAEIFEFSYAPPLQGNSPFELMSGAPADNH
ncbi:hypothetical protein [Burkholderia mayonis]|uniref:hypothetical protein n=1 Tax=Burkholderia mayonis TaxID=1385591 RepID=UPI00131EE4F1|nr:hypothetical protein [Burkholderia mayonis]